MENMDITDKLEVEFFNLGYDRSLDESLDPSVYQRVDKAWNIYFHGFMDEFCDIAYVKTPTVIKPGVYEVTTYDIPAYLFLWEYDTTHPRSLKGLIVKADDVRMIDDAFIKYSNNKYSI